MRGGAGSHTAPHSAHHLSVCVMVTRGLHREAGHGVGCECPTCNGHKGVGGGSMGPRCEHLFTNFFHLILCAQFN